MRKTTIVCLAILLIAVGLCCSQAGPLRISRSLAQQARRGPGTVIDFAEVAPFPWERLYVFGPYTPSEDIDACLGFHWDGARWSSIKDNEVANLVVFVQGGKVVESFDHSRGELELEGLTDPKGYARDEARFLVQRLGADGRLTLTKEKKR